MFRRLPQIYIKSVNRNCLRTFAEIKPKVAQSNEKWDIFAGVLLERLPIVSKAFTPIEKEFQSMLWQVELENSLKSNHELQHEREILQAELIKKGKIEIDLDDASSKQTAQDLKDAYVEELKKFQLASRTTDDDKNNNLKSTNRCLEENLYLLIEQKLGNKVNLILPQGKWKDGETMRQTAERILKETCGDSLNVMFYGNAPCGFYKYKYPSIARKDSIGAKVFFFRSSFKSGKIDETISQQFGWHTKEMINKKLKGDYLESVQKFLF